MKRFLREFKEKDHFQTAFLLLEKTAGTDRNGKAFLSVTVGDKTGRLNGRMFERAADVGGFDVGDVVFVKGFVQLYQNRKQIIIHDIRLATEGEYEMPDLVADLGGDPRVHLERLLTIVADLKNPHLRQLLVDTLGAPELQDVLLKTPAAKSIHHAYRGGLLEHVVSIVDVMGSLVKHYPFLDPDLLIFGAIYHDLGKVYELDITEGIHYTRTGRLVGHMVLACEMVDRYAAKQTNFPADLRDVCKHIILAHHGKLEYGSPKLPMLPEAMVVAMIDDLDSKLNTLFHFLKTEVESVPRDENWSHYHPGFERYFYLDHFRRLSSR